MESYADMRCVLRMNFHCDACKTKVMEVLRSIQGVYSVTINAEKGTAEVGGEVDPNMLLWALAGSGRHAEVVWVKFSSPALRRGNYNNEYGSYGYESMDQPYRYKDVPLTEHSWYGMNLQYNPSRRSATDPWYNVDYGYLPPAMYVPGLPPVVDPYEHDEPINFCSIM